MTVPFVTGFEIAAKVGMPISRFLPPETEKQVHAYGSF
jgi:hypothetical protein